MITVLTLEETAKFLKVHPSTIYRLLKKRQIPAFKVGSDWRFNLGSIERWMKTRETAEGNGGISGWTPAPFQRNGH
ncbi:helix-turn-helix domain-containing protein [Candidatus Sumerlaeota bacterium]|nr:helix-turn-helix domain-containing protein [Candidatus Sumerlaeota bacterium]